MAKITTNGDLRTPVTFYTSRLTIKIRDPLAGYVPDLKHMVAVHDPRFVGQKFHIIDIRPDFVTREFLTIVLGERVHG